jgi:hypothetical protein
MRAIERSLFFYNFIRKANHQHVNDHAQHEKHDIIEKIIHKIEYPK